jgi:hypothetical protein
MKRLAVTFCAVLVAGCGVADPTTRFTVSPLTGEITFEDKKDNTIDVQNFVYNPDTRAISFDSLTVQNTASTVRIANVEQLQAVADQMRTVGENFERTFNAFSNVVSAAAPAFGGGGGGGAAPTVTRAEIEAIIRDVLEGWRVEPPE